MSIHSQFGTDAKLEKEGKEFAFSANDDGSVPRVRLSYLSSTSDAYIIASARAYAFVRERDAVPAGTDLTMDQAREANRRAFADAICVGWDDIQGADGTPVMTSDQQPRDYNIEIKANFLRDYPHFHNRLILNAQDIANYQAERKKDKVKN